MNRGYVFVTNLKRLPDTTDVEKLKEFFYNFHDSQDSKNNHVILDVSTGRKLNLTLIALKDVAVKSRRFHYLIASLVGRRSFSAFSVLFGDKSLFRKLYLKTSLIFVLVS